MNEPDYDYVYNQLRKVKNDVSFREKVADWAQHTVYEIYIQLFSTRLHSLHFLLYPITLL